MSEWPKGSTGRVARKKEGVVSIALQLVRLPLERRARHAIHADVLFR
jgi:hypothetical protein